MFHISRNAQMAKGVLFMLIISGECARFPLSAQSENTNGDIWFDPPEVLLQPEGSIVNISWFTTLQEIKRVEYHVAAELVSSINSENGQYELIASGSKHNDSSVNNYTYMGEFEAHANFIGYNKIFVTLYGKDDKVLGTNQLKMTVALSYQNLNDFFTIVLGIIIVFLYVTMGATLDLDVIVQIVKKPIGPTIGLVCQYSLMPLFGFAIGLMLFPDEPLLRLGLFLSGCSPGGGTSNVWTHLFGASLDLSIMMTFVSTVVAFGAVPLWVLTMGPLILKGTEFVIPYKHLAMIMTTMLIPCAIGFGFQRFTPKVAKILEKLVTPLSIFFGVFGVSFGMFSYRYLFSIADWKVYLAGFVLPFIGYCSGALASVIFKRKSSDVIAIAIETGLQNNTIALLLLKFTLERPAADLTVVIPAIQALMTPIPLVVALLVKKGYNWKMKHQTADITTDDDIIKEKQLPNVSHIDMYEIKAVHNLSFDISDEVVR